jgi:hypothetical protein
MSAPTSDGATAAVASQAAAAEPPAGEASARAASTALGSPADRALVRRLRNAAVRDEQDAERDERLDAWGEGRWGGGVENLLDIALTSDDDE